MDDILKNYGKRTEIDDAMHIINTIDHDGFDPYFWISRFAPEKDFQEAMRLLKQPAPDRLSAEAGRCVFAKFVDCIRELLAKIGGR